MSSELAHQPALQGARVNWENIVHVFGRPMALFLGEVLHVQDWKMLADWVRQLELFVRRIIILGALRLTLPELKPRKPRLRAACERKAVTADPATWPVGFRMGSAPRASVPHRRRRRDEDIRVLPVHRLAFRLEALRGVINDPDAAIKRFARRLARNRAYNARANTPRRIQVQPYKDCWDTLGQKALRFDMQLIEPEFEAAVAAYHDSS